ncbi:Ig-like domain-containing protein [Synechococcus sp. AH-736-M02]|nr:Ig-like domain-containing protein [Synechococcus sp. AH-736-M02]
MVSSLFLGSFSDHDANDDLLGIVVVENSTDTDTDGLWQFSSDGGRSWVSITTEGVSNSSGFYISADDYLRFVPVSGYSRYPDSLGIRLVDTSFEYLSIPDFSQTEYSKYNSNSYSDPELVDIDNDGDHDLFVGHGSYGITFYRNKGLSDIEDSFNVHGGKSYFGLSFDSGGALSPDFVDIDSDGDYDLFVGNYYGDINYYENVGNDFFPKFVEEEANKFGIENIGERANPTFVDIDGDGDFDLMVGNAEGDTIYFENMGSALEPTFEKRGENLFGILHVGANASSEFVDIDHDGDFDLFLGPYNSSLIFMENVGNAYSPDFSNAYRSPFGLDVKGEIRPSFADMDGGGDLDAFLGAGRDNFYYQNNSTSGRPSSGIILDLSNIDDSQSISNASISVSTRNNELPPSIPSIPDLSPTSDTGSSGSDNLTSVSTPTFVGTADVGTTVELFADDKSLGTTNTDPEGNWSFTVPDVSALADGRTAITATANYFADGEFVLQTSPIAAASPGRTSQEHFNWDAFAALKDDGSVVTWGSNLHGGDSSSVASQLQSGVTQIFTSRSAFAALKADGSVVTWGRTSHGGDSSNVVSQLKSGVTQIFSTGGAFAALKDDGSVVTWGSANSGDSSSAASQLQSGVSNIYSTHAAFAALKDDGSVVTWGLGRYGGDAGNQLHSQLQSDISQVFSTRSAFAALKADGSVVSWGGYKGGSGGDSSSVSLQLRSGVTQIFSTDSAFAALKEDGSVITWGSDGGGDSSSVASQLQSGVTQICTSSYAFAALKADGSVVTWGLSSHGGDSSNVVSQLKSGVTQIFSTEGAFAALKDDGSVVTWGSVWSGGDSSSAASQLQSGVSNVYSTFAAFAAFKDDGSVVTWGGPVAPSSVASGVSHIYSTYDSLAALKDDGSVVTWGGGAGYAGDSRSVASQLQGGVVSFADPFNDDRLIPAVSLTSDRSPVLAITIDTTSPVITSDGIATAIDENSGANQLIYTTTSTDVSSVFYSLKGNNNEDSLSFAITPTTGEVSLNTNPDYEAQSSYAFTVIATDEAGNSSEQSVSLVINNLEDTGPSVPSPPDLISASDTGSSDSDDLTTDTTPTFVGNADVGTSVELFADQDSLGTTTTDGKGEWSFTVPGGSPLPDGNINITAIATDSDGKSTSPSSNLDLTVDTIAPIFTSAVSAADIDENSGSNQVIYIATATDTSSVSYSLKLNNNDDSSFFSIDQLKGEVILNDNPDFERQSSYSFTVVAMDAAGLSASRPFTLSVNNISEPSDTLSLTKAIIDGETLTLDFNSALDNLSTPNLDFWRVEEDSKEIKIVSIEQRSSAGRILLTLENPVDSQSLVTLNYRDLKGDQDQSFGIVQDRDGYDLATISDLVVENQTERASTELDVLFAEVDGNKVFVAFNRELDDVRPSAAPFRFKANGRKVSIKNAVIDAEGRELTLTLSRSIRFDETAKLMYTDADGDQRNGVVQDAEGNDLSSFNIDVENVSPPESKLKLLSGEAEDGLITLDFNEQLSGTKLSKKRFKVKVNSKKAKVDSADLFPEDGYIEININKNIEFGDDVLISYKDLNGDQADGVIQDGYGSDLATFKNFAPDVTAPDEAGPILEEAYIDDGQLYLEFDEIIAPGKVKGSRINLRADGKRVKVKGTKIEEEDTVAIFDLKKKMSSNIRELLFSYKDPKRNQASGVIQDLIGNDMTSLQNYAVEIVSL